ncbi:ParA family protein [Haloarcula onubensis]|uniref:ParA family protein n=1 Tax=Haloarcula onubensis TaxID=2950539 RepID=A0ABU2FVG8_9EURY|nr:ParA family protein [Halomicroarcula sp. S3CR25-11]MDS0284754.1 ParA family protein [Halomicroarcula sp. S3CR25-11]
MTETSETTGTTAPVVAMLNQKGGVGKTTLTVQLGGLLASRGWDVLAVDLEPEGALTSILGFDDVYGDLDQPVTLHDLLLDPQSHADHAGDLVLEGPEFDLLPAHEKMVDNTASALEGEPKARERLGMALDTLRDDYDAILVDNEPSINVLTDNALRNSDGVVIPTYAEGLSIQGLDRLQKQIASIEEYYGPVNVLALVINRIEHNKQAEAMVQSLRDGFGEHLPVVEIRKRVALQRSLVQEGVSVVAADEETDMLPHLEDLAGVVERELLPESRPVVGDE